MSYYAYLGPLGEVVRHGASFIAARDGFLIGTYNTFGEAMESLRGKGELKHFNKLTMRPCAASPSNFRSRDRRKLLSR